MKASANGKRVSRKSTATAAGRRAVRVPAMQLRDEFGIDDDLEPGLDVAFADEAMDEIDPNLRHRMVSETAYRRHGECGYEDGYDLEDWLQAEADVDHLLHNPRR
jgi:hypothetical protein